MTQPRFFYEKILKSLELEIFNFLKLSRIKPVMTVMTKLQIKVAFENLNRNWNIFWAFTLVSAYTTVPASPLNMEQPWSTFNFS